MREARLKPGHHPSELYDWLVAEGLMADRTSVHFHHFWDEPWWPGAYVVRLSAAGDIAPCEAVDHVVAWDSKPDADLYGDRWPYVQQLFQGASNLAPLEGWNLYKLIHCVLNAQGMSVRQEAAMMTRFVWGRMTIGIRWRIEQRRQRRS